MSILRAGLRIATAAVVLAGLAVAVPQASAADRPVVKVSAEADPITRALVQADPAAAAVAATYCGSGYELSKGIPLPLGTDPGMRLGTLFAYENGGNGCVVLDNNMGKAQYMYLQICKLGGTSCDTDTGNYSQYAGPVYVSSFSCAPVTAKMGSSSSSLYINYKSDYVFPCG
ncbi:hypothetical protein AB0L85_21805 [Streptomyces sp. NPDC052051]|uniref:hypothetical protein n=1 Tax=Streptomyces sp. NPDC052051 TaxID=3154649 RepID=UPI00343E968B